MGYVKAKSLISLLAGLVLGLPIITATLVFDQFQKVTVVASTIACIFFIERFIQTGKLFPSGYGALASLFVSILSCVVVTRKSKSE